MMSFEHSTGGAVRLMCVLCSQMSPESRRSGPHAVVCQNKNCLPGQDGVRTSACFPVYGSGWKTFTHAYSRGATCT